jgi:hypothetical protein
MISSSKVFDMLPSIVDIYDKLDLDTYRKKLQEENKTEKLDAKDLGIMLVKYVLKNSKKVKEELFEIVAVMQEITLEEAKAQGPFKMVTTLKEIFTDKDTVGFFKQAI